MWIYRAAHNKYEVLSEAGVVSVYDTEEEAMEQVHYLNGGSTQAMLALIHVLDGLRAALMQEEDEEDDAEH